MQETFQVHHMQFQPPAPVQPVIVSQHKGEVSMKNANGIFIALCVLVLIGGSATGFGISKLNAKEEAAKSSDLSGAPLQQVATGAVHNGDVFGSQNESIYKDSAPAQGYLEIGGIDGEGSHHILREGGPSQTVYLTSSSTDLDKFQGMNVEVWGETLKGQKAGWLMDVGRIKVLDIKGQPPAGAKTGTNSAVQPE